MLVVGILSMHGWSGLATAQAPPEHRLLIDVFRGEGAVHDVRALAESEVIVRVTDENREPIQGAAVVFQLPASGPGGVFASESRFATVLSDADGIAKAAGLQPNKEIGEFSITVTASYRDYESATVTVTQRNTDSLAAPAPVKPQAKKAGTSSRTIALIAVVVGAAAGAALGLSGGGGGSSPAPTPTPTPSATAITPGTPGFGPPR